MRKSFDLKPRRASSCVPSAVQPRLKNNVPMRRNDVAVADVAKLQRQVTSQQQLLSKLSALSALQMVVHNTPLPVEKFAVEFYYAVTSILEGEKAEDLQLSVIDKKDFLKILFDE